MVDEGRILDSFWIEFRCEFGYVFFDFVVSFSFYVCTGGLIVASVAGVS